MGTPVECPLCRKIQKDWQDYAKHLLADHADDEDRCQWAREMIEMSKNGEKPKAPEEPEKIRGKPAVMIPPQRKKMPKYLRRQLGG